MEAEAKGEAVGRDGDCRTGLLADSDGGCGERAVNADDGEGREGTDSDGDLGEP